MSTSADIAHAFSLKREPINGIPDTLLADCVLNMGKRGSGKSSTFRLAMERALTKRVRCGWVDGMGIGWGIAVSADGKTPGYPGVVVFGGEHGHIPITEGAGQALGTALAKASFSWVLDLKGLKSKASRVRFMAGFIDAIYEHCEEPLLLFMDEVDLWAPQMIIDKKGPVAELLGAMNELVRRGRIKGLSVWMATQRPAEVSKSIISQADALFTFKLMAPQDLEAAMSWMKGHIGKAAAAEWASHIPTLKKGEAIVYSTEPEVSVAQVQFPMIATLDTFSPPKKGKAGPSDKAMAKVDLDAIRTQLGAIEQDLSANDPAALKKTIADLQKQLRAVPAQMGKTVHQVVDLTTEQRSDVWNKATAAARKDFEKEKKAAIKIIAGYNAALAVWLEKAQTLVRAMPVPPPVLDAAAPEERGSYTAYPVGGGSTTFASPRPETMRAVAIVEGAPLTGTAKPTGDVRERILKSLLWWAALGFKSPTRNQVAFGSGFSPTTNNFRAGLATLGEEGKISFPAPGLVNLLDGEGLTPPDVETPLKAVEKVLDATNYRVLAGLVKAWPKSIGRNELAVAVGFSPTTNNYRAAVAALITLGLASAPEVGKVKVKAWVMGETED